MATFMGKEMKGRYSDEVDLLREWFKERLPQLGPFTMTWAEYNAGADKLPDPQKQLTTDAFTEWLTNRGYELSYNQTCQAFFGVANELKLLTINEFPTE